MSYISNETITNWEDNGFINFQLFTKEEVNLMKIELMRLLKERDNDPLTFFEHPHLKSDLFLKITKDERIVSAIEKLMGNDLDIADCKIEATQTWAYFKPPGALGRDVHHNIFYSHANYGEVINVSIAIDDADEENGCLYWYPGSHKDKMVYPIPDSTHTEFESRDESRIKTNPNGQPNERGKPLYVPGTWVDGQWVDKWNKIYVPIKAGSVTPLNSHVLHGSDANFTTNRWRRSFLIQYSKLGGIQSGGKHMKRETISVY
jgi:ectoine hydroxylase-related dioxygenase (phytanoyl-CoA dioxygenase family)